MFKYVEVSGIKDRKDTIMEIKLPAEIYRDLECSDTLGGFFQDRYDFEMIKDWEVFDKPFIERVAEIIHKANIDKQQALNFIHLIKELQEYLFDFPYTRRMEFILQMYKLLNQSYNSGAQMILDRMNAALSDSKSSKQIDNGSNNKHRRRLS